MILHDIAAGHSVVVLDPRGDLVDDILAHYPDRNVEDLVVIDPRDAAPVGINPLYRPANPALSPISYSTSSASSSKSRSGHGRRMFWAQRS